MVKLTWIVALAAALGTCSAALAEPGWLLTDAQFQSRTVDFQGLDSKGIAFIDAQRARGRLDFGDFLEISRPMSPPASAGAFSLLLANGDLLRGSPVGVKDEAVAWKTAAFDELTVKLNDIRAIVRGTRLPEALDAARRDDVVGLSNGDSVNGVLRNITPETVTIDVDGTPSPVKAETVSYILLAAPAQKKALPARALRITLADGSSLSGEGAVLADGKLKLKLNGADERSVDMAQVAAIEQLNGPVTWVSSLAPAKSLDIPYMDRPPMPARMDRSVTGNALRFGRSVFRRGIGVHAKSVLEFELDGRYPLLRTQFAIDGDRPNEKADVTVRILLDGKKVFEQEHFRGGILAPVEWVDLKGAKTLTLEVDFGANIDTQDQFNWIEPALVMKKPPPPPVVVPTTRPATAPSTLPSTLPATKPSSTPAAPSGRVGIPRIETPVEPKEPPAPSR